MRFRSIRRRKSVYPSSNEVGHRTRHRLAGSTRQHRGSAPSGRAESRPIRIGCQSVHVGGPSPQCGSRVGASRLRVVVSSHRPGRSACLVAHRGHHRSVDRLTPASRLTGGSITRRCGGNGDVRSRVGRRQPVDGDVVRLACTLDARHSARTRTPRTTANRAGMDRWIEPSRRCTCHATTRRSAAAHGRSSLFREPQ